MSRVCLTLVVVIGAGLILRAQQQAPPVFKASTRLTVQNVKVTDKKGKPVEGLTAKDFVLTEDGVPQEIAFVEYERLDTTLRASDAEQLTTEPADRARPAPAGAAVASAVDAGVTIPGDARYRGRRLVILYFDAMPFFQKMRAYENAESYVAKHMAAADLLAVMVFNGRGVRLEQDFTDDREALLGALDRLGTEAEDAQTLGAMDVDPGGAFGENNATFDIFEMDRQLAALQTAVTGLGAIPEVKTLVYFGSARNMSDTDNLAQLRATVNAAVRAGVTINPIDARGLVAEPPMGDASRASPGGIGMFSGAIAQRATTSFQRSQDTFYALAKDTGGVAVFDNNDLALGIAEATGAVTGYYMIGYYSTHPLADGRYRRVKVSLAPGLPAELSYRPGYFADKPYEKFTALDKERQLSEALKLEDPITDIPMAVEVNYFQLSRAEYFVPVSLVMPGRELMRQRPNGTSRIEIDVIGEIKDEHSVTRRNMRDKIEIPLDAAGTARVASRPIQYETGFSLLPGSYVIKLLARDIATGRIGTFQRSFTIPNLEREDIRLRTSSVVLTSQAVRPADALHIVKQQIAAETANPLVSEGLKLIPSVTRTFSVSRPLYVFLETYPPSPAVTAGEAGPVLEPLAAFVTLYREGAKVFESVPLVASGGRGSRTRALPIRLTLALGDVPPGPYDCQVTVLDSGGGRAAFWRIPIVLVK